MIPRPEQVARCRPTQPKGTVPGSDKGATTCSALLLPQLEGNVSVRMMQRSMARVFFKVPSAVTDDA